MILPYVDVITVLGTSVGKVDRDRKHAADALAKENIQTDAKKDLIADEADYMVAIGLAWWKDGVLKVKQSHTLRLFCTTSQIVRSKRSSTSQMLLLRCPAFYILFHTFQFIEET